jgi:hypothetical protein
VPIIAAGRINPPADVDDEAVVVVVAFVIPATEDGERWG